ncbi:MAG: glycerophosphodiester phosphodiesterase [Candidatus Limnocylindrales bacterium]|nr:glycerophosphodiester phosphodiesterase [Candidatus Limnocylindrales bacterium]
MSPTRTLRLAHRGDWRGATENTLPAFQAALAVPACDGLEFDVRAAADGVPVVCHDETLARVQGRPERVDALRSDALLDLGVPTLEEVLRAAGRRPFLDVELKGDPGPAVVEVLAAGRGPELHNAVVSSFDHAALEAVARRAPTWPRWLNTFALDDRAVNAALALGCRGVSVEWRALDAVSVGRARFAGLDVAAWTVRRRSTFDRLARLGLVAVCVEGAALDG